MEGFEHLAPGCAGGKSSSSTGPSVRRAKEVRLQAAPEKLGVVPRAVAGLFERVEQRRLTSPDTFAVRLSFLQIYNEKVYDLLNPVNIAGEPNAGLRLRWNPREAG